MAGSDEEKAQKKLEEEKAKAEASALGKSLARLSTEEGSGVRVVERIMHGGGGGMVLPDGCCYASSLRSRVTSDPS